MGAQVAAPIFSRVGSFLMRKDGRSPLILADSKLNHKKVKAQSASSLALAAHIDTVETSDTVPSLKGLTIREVLGRFKDKNIQISFQGEGVVTDTYPPEGAPLQDMKVFLK